MDDAALAAAARQGDQAAWATIYDRYADRLHDHCWSILRDEHEAADALHDAFLDAARALPQLRDPSRLRPWLYAIARNEAFRRHRQRSRVVPAGDLAAEPDAEDPELPTVRVDLDEHDGAPVDELRRLVWDAAGGLSPQDQALLDLHLRQGLEGEELAEALGTTASNTYVRMSRLRDTLERSLGALLVARTGRQDCPELARVLAAWDGELTPLLRKRVARHVEGCERCGERRRAMVSPLALLAGMPVLPAPDELRARTVSAAAGAAAAVPLGPDELFPVPVPPPPVDRPDGTGTGGGAPRWGAIVGILLAVAAVLLVVILVLLFAGGGGGGPDATTTSSSSTSSTSTSTSSSSTSTTTTSTSTSTTSTTTPATPAAIGLSTTDLDFGDTSSSQEVTITNTGGTPLPYTLTTDTSTSILQLNRSGGTLQPGASHTVIATLDRGAAPEGDLSANIRVNGGAAGRPVIGVTAQIAPAPPAIEGLTLEPDAWIFATGSPCDSQVRVAFSDESGVTGRLFWASPGPAGTGNRPLAASGRLLVADLPRALSPSDSIEFWVVLTDALGASVESARRTLTAAAGSC